MSNFINNFVQFIQAYGVAGLAALSFAESSFFPIPPDVLLIPMAFMNRKLALFYALITTVSSVLGGVFGHVIGRKFGKPLLRKFFNEDKINKVQGYFEKYGGWSIAIAGFTPIPYKIFTISAGVFNVRMFTLVMASIFGRGARFFIEGFFIFFLGDTAKYYIENYFEAFTVAVTLLCILVYYIWKKLKASGRVKGTGAASYFKEKYRRIYELVLKYRRYDEAAVYFFIGIFLSLTSLLMFMELIGDYLKRGNWSFDLSAISYVYSLRNPDLNKIFTAITTTGNTISIIIVTIAIAIGFIYIKRKKEALFFALNVLGVWLFNEALKYLFKRPRPSEIRLVQASGYSFPSGHAMIFMGLSIILIYYICNYVKNKKLAVFISILIFIYALFVGISRVYVGVHYLSDVLAGWFAGILWSSSSIVIRKILRYRRKVHFAEENEAVTTELGYDELKK